MINLWAKDVAYAWDLSLLSTQCPHYPVLFVKPGYIFFYANILLSPQNVFLTFHFQCRNQVALWPKPSVSVTSVGGCCPGPSRAAVLLASFRRSGFHGLLLPLPSCLPEGSCNSNHSVTSIAVTPSSLSLVSLDREQPPPPLFLPAGSLGGVHSLGTVMSKREWEAKSLLAGQCITVQDEWAVPPLQPLLCHSLPCMPSMFPFAIVTPNEGTGIQYEQWSFHLFSKHLLCRRQPRNWKWGLCPQGTCYGRGEIKHVSTLGHFWGSGVQSEGLRFVVS